MKHSLVFILLLFFLFSTRVGAQECLSNLVPTAGSNQFDIHNDGTVTHNKTGLMWKVCSEGQNWVSGRCEGDATEHDWGMAIRATTQWPNVSPDEYSFAGHTNWRLPNLKELASIYELKCFDPALNEEVFPDTLNSSYWSSTPSSRNDQASWAIANNTGHTGGFYRYASESMFIRLVRNH